MRKTLCPCPICKSGRCGVCNSAKILSGDLPITHKLITSEDDILSLDIINWGPTAIGGFRNVNEAVGTIASWFINTSHYTTVSVDITKAPARSDFPGWGHRGDHPRIGELFVSVGILDK